MRRLSTVLLAGFMLVPHLARAQVIEATIDQSAKGAPISPMIYGLFLEHAGNLLEQGFRAELLEDRKFYFAVGQPPAVNGRRGRGGPARYWQLVGDGAVRMDSAHAYASAHVPSVSLDKVKPSGIAEGGVALRSGENYDGRIVIAGDPSAIVSVSLVWGAGDRDRQVVRVGPLASSWATKHFQFKAIPVATDSARLEITGTGRGEFRVGAVSLMPADNQAGFRREVISALALEHSGVYRFPGGNFVSGPFDWRDAVGDPDRRAPRWDPVWSAVQPDDFGLDEFVELCRLVGVEPYITVNAGFGDAWSAAEQVEYANGAASTPMGKLRAANGHAKPYGIKYWGIGNEMWGDWQFGYMSLDQWISKQGQFAREMRKADPTIQLVAAGAMPDAMTGSGMAKKLTGKIVAEEMGPADWSAALLSRSIGDFEILSQHFYVYGGTHYDLDQGKQVPDAPDISLLDWARKPASMVRVEYEHFKTYEEKIPAMQKKHITVAIDEWAYSGAAPGAFKPVIAYSWALNEMFRHSEVFTMGGFTFGGSTLSATRTSAVLNPVGLMFQLYSTHYGRIPLAVTGNVQQPERTGAVGGEVPRVNAGSPTYPLDVAAALSDDGKSVTVSVVNPTEVQQQLRIHWKGAGQLGAGTNWRMAPATLTAANAPGKDPQVKIEESQDNPATILIVPPTSVAVHVYPVKP